MNLVTVTLADSEVEELIKKTYKGERSQTVLRLAFIEGLDIRGIANRMCAKYDFELFSLEERDELYTQITNVCSRFEDVLQEKAINERTVLKPEEVEE